MGYSSKSKFQSPVMHMGLFFWGNALPQFADIITDEFMVGC